MYLHQHRVCTYISIGYVLTLAYDEYFHIYRSTHNDEMCNFYMMYYVEGEAEFLECAGNSLPGQSRSMPASSLIKLPPNAKLDEMAAGHHHHHGGAGDEPGNLPVCFIV